MALHFFDIVDGGPQRDDTGTDCATREDVRRAAMAALPDIAKEEIPADGDRRVLTLVVRNEDGHAIYAATLSFAGTWLDRRPGDVA